jgi:hypothetical protein
LEFNGCDEPVGLEALRLHGLPEAAPALRRLPYSAARSPSLPVGQREFAAETTLDLPSLATGPTHFDAAVEPRCRTAGRGAWRDRAQTSVSKAGGGRYNLL